MPEERIATDGGVQPSEPVVNGAPDPAKEDLVDEQVKEILGDIPVVEDKTEDKPAAIEPEKTGDDPEKEKIDAPAEENQPVTPPEEAHKPSKLDRRIAKVYLSNLLLKGHEGEVPDTEEVVQAIKDYPLAEKTKALQNLLSEQNSLRGRRNDGAVDLSEEDHQAIVEAEVENRLQQMQGEIQEREWKDDLVKTVEAHPELNERKNEYNPKIATAVEKLAMKGMKVSEALALVTESISTAKADDKKKAEIEKQKLLGGAVSASHDTVESKGRLTWEELAKKQEADPNFVNSEEYMKLVKDGKLPKE
jgi:hypothetical protein